MDTSDGPFRDPLADGLTPLEQLLGQVARAADLCRPPLWHAVVHPGDCFDQADRWDDLTLVVEARNAEGERCLADDLELEIYRSGGAWNLMLTLLDGRDGPVLWHGHHSVWMDSSSGERCAQPQYGASLEALARRIRALLGPD